MPKHVAHQNQAHKRHRTGSLGGAALVGQVKLVRGKHDMSQEDLARLLGASWATVSRWERGVAKPSAEAEARMKRLVQLSDRIDDALPRGELVRFLTTPNPLLRGYQPQDLLGSSYSFDDLLDFVEGAKSGDMA